MNIDVDWSELKEFIDSGRNVEFHYTKARGRYHIVAADGWFRLETSIVKSEGVKGTNQVDFETNYIDRANNKIKLNSIPVSHSLTLNGSTISSKSLNVNGSSTNQSFRYQPDLHSESELVYLRCLSVEIEDQGNFLAETLGTVNRLPNGLQINIKSNGVVHNITNIRDNADLYGTFNQSKGSQSVAVLLQSNRNMYFATMNFSNRVILDPSQGDYLEVVVRDNLSGLNSLNFRVCGWRAV